MDEQVAIIEVLKRALKKHKITYADLATELGLSEAGIKKMFKNKDLPLSRLVKICGMMNLTVDTLLRATRNRPLKRIRFNSEQTEFFLANPHYFFFFLKLVYEDITPEEIAQEFDLDDRSVWRYLKKLDDLRLIKLDKGNKVFLERAAPIVVDTTSEPRFEIIRRRMAQSFVKSVVDRATDRNQIKMSSFKLSEERHKEMLASFGKILAKYKRVSEVERVLEPKSLQLVSALCVVANWSFLSGIKNL